MAAVMTTTWCHVFIASGSSVLLKDTSTCGSRDPSRDPLPTECPTLPAAHTLGRWPVSEDITHTWLGTFSPIWERWSGWFRCLCGNTKGWMNAEIPFSPTLFWQAEQAMLAKQNKISLRAQDLSMYTFFLPNAGPGCYIHCKFLHCETVKGQIVISY